jgi:hypothetical protein
MIAGYWSTFDVIEAWATAIVILLVLLTLAFDLVGIFTRWMSRGEGVNEERISAVVNAMYADKLHVHIDPTGPPLTGKAAPWNQIVEHRKGH